MITCTVEIPWTDVIHLVFIGDEHIGNRATREDILQKVVGGIGSDEHAYAVFLGDAIDAINVSDKRFDPRVCAEWINVIDLLDISAVEIEHYAEIVKPIADKILGVCCGNHEDVLARRYEKDVYRLLWNAVGVPEDRRLGPGGFIRLKIRDNAQPCFRKRGGSKRAWEVIIFAHHGFGGGRLMGGVALNLERLPGRFLADIYALGHSHHRMGFMLERVTVDGPRRVACLNVGSFLMPYDTPHGGYASRKLMLPQDCGPVFVDLFPPQRDIQLII